MNANISLVNLYYRTGKVFYDNSTWGNKFLDKLAFELKNTYPNQKGFSVRNLKYMKTFYSEYHDDLEFVHLDAQLPWKHNVSLIEIELADDYKEKELEKRMLERLKNVLLELGNGFSSISNQYKLTVGNKDFYIDLLFYHIKLKCYIAVELKMDEFIPEYGSKIGFYLQALDEQVKDKDDNYSIGIILCPNKNNKIVDYTLKYINKPIGVSDYKILDKLPTDYMENLPTEEDLNMYIDINE